MVTIYDLLEVDEKASKEEIEKAYQRLLIEYHQDPNLTAKENADNEIILNRVKIAYDILIDDEKRNKYDKDLAKKRAEDLIKNVSINNNQEEDTETQNQEQVQSSENSTIINTGTYSNTENSNVNQTVKKTVEQYDEEYDDSYENEEELEEMAKQNEGEEEATLSKKEQIQIQKAAQEEFKNNLKRAQKAEEEYNKAYNQAYNSYMKKMGYNVKEPFSVKLKRFMNVALVVIVTIVVCFIAWLIPPVRKMLTELYNDNIIIKSLVDITVGLFKSIIGIFK